MRFTRIGIAIFVLVVIAGPLYTVPGYSAVGNLISELAAQNTPRNFIMSGAFIALGSAIVVDGFRPFHRALAPFMTFGLLVAVALLPTEDSCLSLRCRRRLNDVERKLGLTI